ncbi:MAG: hypothetical protein AB7F23_02010 [Phycisphaerae bacterium]|jgi:uncharacterized lipoprotein YmbA
MKTKLFLVLLAFAAAGCASSNYSVKALYLLDSPRLTRDISQLSGLSIFVDRFETAQPFDTCKFVYKTGASKYEVDHYREFLVPPSVMVQLQTSDWLEDCGVKLVLSRGNAEFAVKGFITEFYLDASEDDVRQMVLEVRFFVFHNGEPIESFTLRAEDKPESNTADEFVASADRSLRNILTRFERRLAELRRTEVQ